VVEVYALVGAAGREDALCGWLGGCCGSGWRDGEAGDGGTVGVEEEGIGEGDVCCVVRSCGLWWWEGCCQGMEDALIGPGDDLNGDGLGWCRCVSFILCGALALSDLDVVSTIVSGCEAFYTL